MEQFGTSAAFGQGYSMQFLRTGLLADGVVAANVRREFGTWLKRHFALDAERLSDVLLAVNEALANAADYAYPAETHFGTVDVSAVLGSDDNALTVTVADHGAWRDTVAPESRRHGRGIPLMRALADVASIDGTAHGTLVTMVWRNVSRRLA